MSKKRPPITEQLKLPQPTNPALAASYADTYRYNIDGDGVLTVWFAQGGHWHTAIAMPVNLSINLHQQLGESIATVLRRNAGVPESPAPPTEPA